MVKPEDKRRERVVTLFTASELERIDRFRAEQKIPTRTELFRQAILSQVERWERKLARV